MSGLKAAREALVALLAANGGPHVLAFVPEAIAPPVAVLEPSDQYVGTGDEDATFAAAEHLVQVDLWLLVDLVDNQAATDNLDALLEAVLARVEPSTWFVQVVNKPGPVHTSEWMAYGVRVTLGSWITL